MKYVVWAEGAPESAPVVIEAEGSTRAALRFVSDIWNGRRALLQMAEGWPESDCMEMRVCVTQFDATTAWHVAIRLDLAVGAPERQGLPK